MNEETEHVIETSAHSSESKSTDILNDESSEQVKDENALQKVKICISQKIPDDDDLSNDTRIPNKDRLDPPTLANETNEKLLTVAFLSFMSFTIIQTFAAYIAESDAMMGDSAAMCVDALSYAMNLIAERQKRNVDDPISNQSIKSETCTEKNESVPTWEHNQFYPDNRGRRRKCVLELVPPILSIIVLLLVTVIMTRKAVNNLLADQSLPRTSPNTLIMAIFSSLNLLLDILNLLYFMRNESQTESGSKQIMNSSVEYNKISLPVDSIDDFEQISYESDKSMGIDHSGKVSETNLNMCSAFTHVIADTIRSMAVIIAAATASLSSTVTPAKADAIAAIIVAAVIVLSLFPLLKGLYLKCLEFRKTNETEILYSKINDRTIDSYECVKLIPKI